MYLDIPRIWSICHFSYYMRSVRQFILFINEISALPFDKFLWHPPTNKRKIVVGDEIYTKEMRARTKKIDREDIISMRYCERSVWVLIVY